MREQKRLLLSHESCGLPARARHCGAHRLPDQRDYFVASGWAVPPASAAIGRVHYLVPDSHAPHLLWRQRHHESGQTQTACMHPAGRTRPRCMDRRGKTRTSHVVPWAIAADRRAPKSAALGAAWDMRRLVSQAFPSMRGVASACAFTGKGP